MRKVSIKNSIILQKRDKFKLFNGLCCSLSRLIIAVQVQPKFEIFSDFFGPWKLSFHTRENANEQENVPRQCIICSSNTCLYGTADFVLSSVEN